MTASRITRRKALGWGVGAVVGSAIPAVSRAADRMDDVLVLGAGMAGLHAARILQKEGLAVTVLEGSPRVGGRCWTARSVPGRPELGATEIGHNYGRVRGNAIELGVALVDPLRLPASVASLPTAVAIGGPAIPVAAWATAPANQLTAEERPLSPPQLWGRYVGAKSPLASLDDWLKPEFASLDDMSLRQYFVSLGASEQALHVIADFAVARNLDEANALDTLRKAFFYAWEGRSGAYHVVRDGTDALTTAMAGSLTRAPLLDKPVVAVEAMAREVRVSCADGTTYRARTAISTLPPSIFRTLPVTGPVTSLQRAAWRDVAGGQLLMVFAKVDERYWERDGMAPTLWSDSPVERVFYVPPRGDDNGTLVAFINGERTDRRDRLTADDVAARFMTELARVRPSMQRAVHVTHVHNWTTYPFARGHVAAFRPGSIGRYATALVQPVGSLQFAGEHCGRLHAGIEAACESGEAAALRVLEDIGSS